MAGNPNCLSGLCVGGKKGAPAFHPSIWGEKTELETDPWPPNELRLAAHLEKIHSYTVTHSWCDNFIPTSSTAEHPAGCASGTKAVAYNKFSFFPPLLEMLGL